MTQLEKDIQKKKKREILKENSEARTQHSFHPHISGSLFSPWASIEHAIYWTAYT